jgi:hypothetical protein
MIIECPHCQTFVLIEEIYCGIFRHGQYKDGYKFVEPHMSENDCKRLLESDLVYGCMKPFRIVKKSKNEYNVEICGYI